MLNLVLLSKVKDEISDVKELLKLPFERQFYLIDNSVNFAVKSLIENAIFDARSNLNKFIRYEFCPFSYHDGAENNLMWLAEKSETLKHGGWIVKLDAKERISTDYYNILLGSIPSLEKNNIFHMYKKSKLMIWKYFEDMVFMGAQHPSLWGRRGQGVDITKMQGWRDDFLYHTSEKNHIESWVINGFRYFSSGRSNQIDLIYSEDSGRGNSEIIKQQTANRYVFRETCRKNNIEPNFDNLTIKFKEWKLDKSKVPHEIVQFIENEMIIKNYFRYILGDDLKQIYEEQKTWSFINWLNIK